MSRALVAVLLAVGWAAVGGAGPARAEEPVCPPQFLPLGSVQISAPQRGATVSGQVRVSGRASTPLPLGRVELIVDGSVVDSRTYTSSAGSQFFDLVWDSSAAPVGTTRLLVVACGGQGGLFDQVARGELALDVVVVSPPTSVTLPPTSVAQSPPSTAGAGSRPATPPATNAGTGSSGTTPLSAAAGTGGAGASVSSTTPTTAEAPPTTFSLGARTDPEPTTEVAGPAQTGRLSLTEGTEESDPGPPIWVGLVVGLSGTIGLVLSAIFRRSHASAAGASDSESEFESEDDLVGV